MFSTFLECSRVLCSVDTRLRLLYLLIIATLECKNNTSDTCGQSLAFSSSPERIHFPTPFTCSCTVRIVSRRLFLSTSPEHILGFIFFFNCFSYQAMVV